MALHLTRRASRTVYTVLGALCVALGAVGAAVPGLPTTPFLLLAAACFGKGSRRAQKWLLRNRLFGPIIRTWENERAITLRMKVTSSVLVVAAIVSSIVWGVENPALRITLVVLGAIGLVVVVRLPTARRPRIK